MGREAGALTQAQYRDYISSPQWRATRERYWASGMPKDCAACGTPRRSGFHLHHKSYNRLGQERLHDLVPLCPDCHEYVHSRVRSWATLWRDTNRAMKDRRKGRR